MKRKASVRKTVKKKTSARRGGLKSANLRKVRGGAWAREGGVREWRAENPNASVWQDKSGDWIGQRPGEGPVFISHPKA